MSLIKILLLLAAAGLVGIGVGYVLRWLVSLGQKGSVELEIKQRLLEAREEAKKVVSEGEKRAAELEDELRETLKRKEEAKPAEPAKPSAEVALLTEIRDLLKTKA